MSVVEITRTIEFAFPRWSVAEFLDTPFADGLVLRAVICRLSVGQWQWSIMSIGKGHGELIGVGTERTVTAARRTAASELDKCIRDPLAMD